MSIRAISDPQLYALLQNDALPTSLREDIQKEAGRRNIPAFQTEELKLQYDNRFAPRAATLHLTEKALIIFLSGPIFLCGLSIIGISLFGFIYLSRARFTKWQQFWQYLSLGLFAWTVALLALISAFGCC